ncbi:hypothetical protein BXZ70DRAFT_911747 [Cristinia sonorae]|uniref:Uncharacterized protein n=1 Tax=Cristinia sonorae TaxID=1940300 RepID=A0A8K0UDM5_9AGAR|nr:hypothetical protein BXZ70DRAFT_911747 [Cristinia sonorae]
MSYCGVGITESVLLCPPDGVYHPTHISHSTLNPHRKVKLAEQFQYFAPKCDSLLPNGCLNMIPHEISSSNLVTSPVFKHPDSGIDDWIGELRDFHALCTGASQQLFQKLAAEESRVSRISGACRSPQSPSFPTGGHHFIGTKASPSMYDMLVTVAKQNAHVAFTRSGAGGSLAAIRHLSPQSDISRRNATSLAAICHRSPQYDIARRTVSTAPPLQIQTSPCCNSATVVEGLSGYVAQTKHHPEITITLIFGGNDNSRHNHDMMAVQPSS